MSNTSPFKVFSGTNSRYLAEKICKSLGCDLGNMNITHFADGEFAVAFLPQGVQGMLLSKNQSVAYMYFWYNPLS